jgi:hypothetical protein
MSYLERRYGIVVKIMMQYDSRWLDLKFGKSF